MDKTHVWVQTSLVSKIAGPIKKDSTNGDDSSSAIPKKSLTPKKSSCDFDRTGGDWSWCKCTILAGDAFASDQEGDLKIQVQDKHSEYHGKQVTIPSKLLKTSTSSANVLHANEYEYASEDDDLSGENGASNTPSDLIHLTHLHEPSVVYCLRKRYEENMIYTNTGPILLALNPFKELPGLYDDRTMEHYWARGEQVSLQHAGDDQSTQGGTNTLANNDLPPHIYAMADAAFRQMMRGMELKRTTMPSVQEDTAASTPSPSQEVMVDQAVLVSGESGAGKTVATKHIMAYLATLSQRKAAFQKRRRAPSPGRRESSTNLPRRSHKTSSIRRMSRAMSWKAGAQIEERILQSNPILESFGNARTVRNDNSSRFGKFIELQFKQTGSLISAKIDTYLLETVRLIYQAQGERNFHIFYELLAAATKPERAMFYLQEYTAQDFKMTSASGCMDRRDGADDADLFDELVVAMGTMGFDPDTQDDLFRVMVAFLHSSNLEFLEVSSDDSSKVDESNPHLQPTLKLLGLEKDAFEKALCEFEIEAGNTSYTKKLSKENAQKGLEALVKATYRALFDFIVQTVNKKIEYTPKRGEPAQTKAGFIGVLDIFGFESFQQNSFEQLCINYCNEALQQQFNKFIFKSEQAEYQAEGIQWEFITFPDNQDVIELIDKRGTGIISLLADQCRNLRGNDKSFADLMYQTCDAHSRFEAKGLTRANGQFVVLHYAGPVKYETDGFVEKNKSEIPRGASELLQNSSNSFVQLLGSILSNGSNSSNQKSAGASAGGRVASRAKLRPTVGSTFTSQLSDLRKRIDATAPHYIRCLKPNQNLVPDEFMAPMIADQLRYAGVLEAIRVSRVGYSQRYTLDMFLERYRFIAITAVDGASSKMEKIQILIEEIAKRIWKDKNSDDDATPDDLATTVGIQKGKTKVFLRQSAFDYMESFRAQQLDKAAIIIQAQVRRFICRCRFIKTVHTIIVAQSCVRRFLARKFMRVVQERKAATLIASFQRMYIFRKKFLQMKYVTLWMQKQQRGIFGRAIYEKRQQEAAKLQKEYIAAVWIQCMFRSWVARAIHRNLKDEAKARRALEKKTSIAERYALEKNKLEIAAARTTAIAKGRALDKDKEVDELQKELEKTRATAGKVAVSKEEITRLHAEVESLHEQLEASRRTSEAALDKLAAAEAENKKLKEQLQSGGGTGVPLGYKNEAYNGHEDLKQMDERMVGLSSRSKQSKKDLEQLVLSLAILKQGLS